MMSVPRPAMLVATVTAPLRPACATTCASLACSLALSTVCGMPRRLSRSETCSDFSTDVVPSSTGWPLACRSAMSSTIAAYFASVGAVDEVGLVVADHRPVGRDRDHAEPVDLVELRGLGHGRTGHAAELVVEPEVVLQRDRRERLVLLADLHALLGLDRLVQAFVVATAVQHAAGVLVDDEHLALDHDVVAVDAEQLLGLDRVVEVGDERRVDRVVEVLDAEVVLGAGRCRPRAPRRCASSRRTRSRYSARIRPTNSANSSYHLTSSSDGPEMISGRPRLVDEDRVDLVDDRVVVAALDTVLDLVGHVVAEVVEAELVVGAVGDVGGVGRSRRCLGGHLREHHADAEAEEVVDPAHPLGVILREVVVDGDDVDALAGESVEVDRQGRDEGLALTGLHLGDVAEVERSAAHQLDVEVPLSEHALGGLAHGGERLGKQVVERLSLGQAVP